MEESFILIGGELTGLVDVARHTVLDYLEIVGLTYNIVALVHRLGDKVVADHRKAELLVLCERRKVVERSIDLVHLAGMMTSPPPVANPFLPSFTRT